MTDTIDAVAAADPTGVHTFTFVAGLPQLDIHTLSEDWALAASLEAHWVLLARSVGRRPSDWIDTQGDRMYGAVVRLATMFDLENPIREDDLVDATCTVVAIRKPYALSQTRYVVAGDVKARVDLLTCFIKRKVRGANKKFAKTRDLWTVDDVNGEDIDNLIDEHHYRKSDPAFETEVKSTHRTEINRIRDFNTADFLYFKNFVLIAKAAEWTHGRTGPVRLNARRECWYYGNVEDGDVVETQIHAPDDRTLVSAHYASDGRRIFLSHAEMTPVNISVR